MCATRLIRNKTLVVLINKNIYCNACDSYVGFICIFAWELRKLDFLTSKKV